MDVGLKGIGPVVVEKRAGGPLRCAARYLSRHSSGKPVRLKVAWRCDDLLASEVDESAYLFLLRSLFSKRHYLRTNMSGICRPRLAEERKQWRKDHPFVRIISGRSRALFLVQQHDCGILGRVRGHLDASLGCAIARLRYVCIQKLDPITDATSLSFRDSMRSQLRQRMGQ